MKTAKVLIYTSHFLKFTVFCFGLLSLPIAHAQAPVEEPTAENAEISVNLTVLRGDPEKGGGEVQEFQLKNGDTIFINVQQKSSAKEKVDVPYEGSTNRLSTEIANKIADIQSKQKEYNEEIYPAYRAPIDLEKQSMESELQNLQRERDRVESSQRSNQAQQKIQAATMPEPKAKLASGFSVQVTVDKDSGDLNFVVTPKGLKGSNASATTIQAPVNKWIKLLGKDEGDGNDIWIKAEIVEPQH